LTPHTWLHSDKNSATCHDQTVVAATYDSCMSNWGFDTRHEPQLNHVLHGFGATLWDADTGWCGNDDPIRMASSGAWAQMRIDWEWANLSLRDFKDPASFLYDEWAPVVDNEPISLGTGNTGPYMYFEFDPTELPPGEQ
jgi:hypothetical protein